MANANAIVEPFDPFGFHPTASEIENLDRFIVVGRDVVVGNDHQTIGVPNLGTEALKHRL